MTLLATEFLKMRTVATPFVLLAIAQVVVVAGAAGAFVTADDRGDPSVAVAGVAHVGLVSLFAMVLGITAVAGEYRTRNITDTYLTTPRRARVVGSKLVAYTLVGGAFGAVSGVTAVLATAAGLALSGEPVDLGRQELWRTLAGGVVWNTAFAAIGVGLGALVRNLTAAVVVALAWLALAEGIVGQLIGDLRQVLPFAAGLAAEGRAPDGDLSQYAAALVLAVYALVFAVVAVSTTVRRDVT
jgi:ABC-2 type transport system permease protein